MSSKTKKTTNTGRQKRSLFTIEVKQKSGRGEGVTDEMMNDIKTRYKELYESFTKGSKDDQDALKDEMNKQSDGLGDAFASGDDTDFDIAITDILNKENFVDLLIDFGLEVELPEPEKA